MVFFTYVDYSFLLAQVIHRVASGTLVSRFGDISSSQIKHSPYDSSLQRFIAAVS